MKSIVEFFIFLIVFRVSYYELQVNENEKIKQKSSGLSVCTGTGSTSWYFNINKLTDRCVRDLMQISKKKTDIWLETEKIRNFFIVNEELEVNLPIDDQAVISRLCKRFNEQLIFSPSDLRKRTFIIRCRRYLVYIAIIIGYFLTNLRCFVISFCIKLHFLLGMAYTVRDPVFNATFPPCPPRGFAQKVLIKSRCFDAHLVIDGGMSYIFNDGAQAVLEMHPEDALRTVIFR